MTDHTELQKEIVSLLAHLNVEVSAVDEDLLETGLLDSLKIVELLEELEKRFRLKIPVDDLEIDGFRSIASIADFVVKHNGLGKPNAVSLPSPSRDTQPGAAE